MARTFTHDSNARNDEKLIRLRMKYKSAGYGVYFMLLEIMRETKNYAVYRDYNAIAYELREDAALIKAVVEDSGLFVFTDDGKYFYSENFRQRMEREAVPEKKPRKSVRKAAPVEAEAADCGATQAELFQEPVRRSLGGDYIDEMKGEGIWTENMCMNHGIGVGELFSYIEKFRTECKCTERVHLDVTDCKRHFNSWLRIVLKNEKNEPKRNRPGNTKAVAFEPEDYEKSF